jgi:hypothetical protein
MVNRVFLAMIIVAPGLARADPDPGAAPGEDADQSARSRLALTLGLLTPTGELGVEYTQIVVANLEVGAGVGLGVYGPQASIMPRLRAGSARASVTLGVGISGGPYSETSGGGFCLTTDYDRCEKMETNTTVLWSNVEIGYQTTWPGGGMLRAYCGAGKLVAHGACTGPRCGSIDGMDLPYLGIAVGHTL